MEIDEAIRDSVDLRMKNKYKSAIYVIQRALSLYSIEEVAFSFNGGKDSTVLLHLLRAGYFLHQVEHRHLNEGLSDGEFAFPIRTIYFETPSVFPKINSFTHETVSSYSVQLDMIREDFKCGLEVLLKAKPTRAIFLGVRIGDPTSVGQEQFSPSSPGWPTFMRVNPILDWSYRDVWAFLLTCKIQYCSLYDQGYTSVGSIHDTVPNALLQVNDSVVGKQKFKPAYMLSDGRFKRAGRARKLSQVDQESYHGGILVRIKRVDSVADEVERLKSMCDLVFVYGGVGLLHSDVTIKGVAKAFGVCLIAQLPEGITELLQHEKLHAPLIKCHNVIVLSATDVDELDQQWDALTDLKSTNMLASWRPFVSKHLTTPLSDDQETVEAAMDALSKKLSSGVKRISV